MSAKTEFLSGGTTADGELLRTTAARTGLGLKYISKEDKISNLLSILSDWKDIKFALKDGTALNRVYLGEHGRFSEDLDIDVFGKVPADVKIKKLDKLLTAIESFDIKGPRMLHLTARYDCFYIVEFNDKDRVMLEFYLANKKPVSVKPIENVLIRSRYIETSPSIFPCYSLEDLVAQKFITLYFRKQGKDLYDIFHGLDLEFDRKAVKKAMKLRLELRNSKMSAEAFLEQLQIKEKEFMDISTQLMNSTNHFIPRNQRPNWKILIATVFDKIERFVEE